ncbi:hypothetical protein [Dictyobacter arantiisoli]|uniref:Anaphase-promoting complex subunit 4 WD40 domain-containing protein n=1 Tax=Dictyobacter arantiisoli TaxID=2014874 RepID=A0A5A5TDA4_9CHLR|nr:hypothetical protein [Dictyobacter arantiisoli]GCF09185.1 hypothetical protein KDI_27490 [Dictyobacter arantiisoli]
MSEHGKEDHEQSQQASEITRDKELEQRLSQFFNAETKHIHMTPQLRASMLLPLRQKPAHRYQSTQKYLVYTLLAVAVMLLVVFASLSTFAPHLFQPQSLALRYKITRDIVVAEGLAKGGQLLSLDPTEQRIVYQPANQAGTLYMADIANPLQSNTLVMRDAHDMAWAPDGSALVATITATQAHHPFLALAPKGQYMHFLGLDALSANWSTSKPHRIMYILQGKSQTQLWTTTTSGAPPDLQIKMKEKLLVQHMLWSPNGKNLALIVSSKGQVTKETLNQPGREIYVMNIHTHKLTLLVPQGNFTLGAVAWSPNGQNLAYEQINPTGASQIQTLSLVRPSSIASIIPRQHLIGWSWSPDSHALIYSDGGRLVAHVFSGATPLFPQTQAQLHTPFWLKNGQILCMKISNGTGSLIYLTPQTI